LSGFIFRFLELFLEVTHVEIRILLPVSGCDSKKVPAGPPFLGERGKERGKRDSLSSHTQK
jgi:hypothetical protein